MNANPILLQKKYARVVELFAKENAITVEKALDIFYHSQLYELMSNGAVSYTHLRAHETDSYLVCRLLLEKKKNPSK